MSKCLVGPKFITEINGKTGSSINLQPEDVGGLSEYTCTTSEGNHALVGKGNNIKFIADANYSEGNTITVNGKTVAAKLQNGDPLPSDAWVTGAVVICYLNGDILNFKGGGGAVTVTGLDASAIKTGTTVTVKQGAKTVQTVTGTFTSDANTWAGAMLSGNTAYVKGAKVTGTIPSKAAATYTPGTVNQTITAGWYLSGAQTIKGDPNLAGKNILVGKSIFGQSGALTCLAAWYTRNNQIYGFRYDEYGQYKIILEGEGITMSQLGLGGVPVFCTIKPYKTTYAYTIEAGYGAFVINPGQTNVVESEVTGGQYIKQNVVIGVENAVFVLGYHTV